MKIIIMAAGYAVRLQPLTLNMPKPLLEIGGRKIIDRILDKVAVLKKADSIFIVSNARFYQKFSDWLRGLAHKADISLINDGTLTNETRLGAIKDMELAIREKSIDDDILVIAGDNLFDFDLEIFVEFAKAHSDGVSVALYDIKNLESARSFGVVKVDASNKIVDFEEKPQNPRSTLVSTGIYYFPKDKISLIHEYVKMDNKLDAPGYYIAWLAKGHKVYGFSFSEDWYDIGSMGSFTKANEEYFKKEKGENG